MTYINNVTAGERKIYTVTKTILEATYFCGMLTVRSRAGRFLGRKSAEDWMHPTPLDAIRALLDAEDAATRERR